MEDPAAKRQRRPCVDSTDGGHLGSSLTIKINPTRYATVLDAMERPSRKLEQSKITGLATHGELTALKPVRMAMQDRAALK
ncbi:hypothetical protein FRC10_004527 [Ceratobasidium sp. 414]|nr:hypothetical protein FRC10_004527 [Ceratobasidium sp. 414]